MGVDMVVGVVAEVDGDIDVLDVLEVDVDKLSLPKRVKVLPVPCWPQQMTVPLTPCRCKLVG